MCSKLHQPVINLIFASSILLFSGVGQGMSATKIVPLASSQIIPSFEATARKNMELEKKRNKLQIVAQQASKKRVNRRPSKPLTISINFSQPYGNGSNITEQGARVKLYENASGECKRITKQFPGFCQLSRFKIQSSRQGIQKIVAQAQYTVTK